MRLQVIVKPSQGSDGWTALVDDKHRGNGTLSDELMYLRETDQLPERAVAKLNAKLAIVALRLLTKSK